MELPISTEVARQIWLDTKKLVASTDWTWELDDFDGVHLGTHMVASISAEIEQESPVAYRWSVGCDVVAEDWIVARVGQAETLDKATEEVHKAAWVVQFTTIMYAATGDDDIRKWCEMMVESWEGTPKPVPAMGDDLSKFNCSWCGANLGDKTVYVKEGVAYCDDCS